MTDDEWDSAINANTGTLLINLIKEKKCPAYTVESIGLAGRCVPDFGLIPDDAQNTTQVTDDNNNPIQGEGGIVNMQDVLDSIKSIIDILNLQQFAEKIFSDMVKAKWMLLAGVAISKIFNLSLFS